MPQPNPQALAFLETRRSRPARSLAAPVPDREALRHLLTVAARSPDHGKLEPWRFLVLEKPALARLADTLPAKGQALGIEPEKIAKTQQDYRDATLAVVVVASPKASDKVPEIEQTLSAGAVCMNLVSAALASGWGASWITGWASHDRDWRERNLGLMPHEWIAGIVHIGTDTQEPPDRPRPDVDALTEWFEA